jgi:hypothetical protein
MKITRCSSEMLAKYAANEAQPLPQAPEQPQDAQQNQNQPRDAKSIAQAIGQAAKAMQLHVSVGTESGDGSYMVMCSGGQGQDGAAIVFKFVVGPFGPLSASVDRGMEQGMEVVGLMRHIIAEACKNSGIGALPLDRELDPVMAGDPNIYKAQAAARAGGPVNQVGR